MHAGEGIQNTDIACMWPTPLVLAWVTGQVRKPHAETATSYCGHIAVPKHDRLDWPIY